MLQSSLSDCHNTDILFLSQRLINHLYAQRFAELLTYLDPSIVWIDTTRSRNQFSYYQVNELFSRPSTGFPSQILHMQYHINTMAPGLVIVTGKYQATQKTTERSRVGRAYHVTMIWSGEHHTPRLLHIHISTAPATSQTRKPLHFHGPHAETYQLFPDEILYIEADNTNCTVYGLSNQFAVCHSLSEIDQLLPKEFLRVHRSFIINCHYVTRIYRYAIELTNQITVPVPEKKYMGVVCAIEGFRG